MAASASSTTWLAPLMPGRAASRTPPGASVHFQNLDPPPSKHFLQHSSPFHSLLHLANFSDLVNCCDPVAAGLLYILSSKYTYAVLLQPAVGNMHAAHAGA